MAYSSLKEVRLEMCRTCQGNGVIPVRQFSKGYRRWFVHRQRTKARRTEPYAKMRKCPDCA